MHVCHQEPHLSTYGIGKDGNPNASFMIVVTMRGNIYTCGGCSNEEQKCE
jgi:hypothetical protein